MAACISASVGGCAAPRAGYGVAPERQAAVAEAGGLTAANTRSTYMDLIGQMQAKGLWFASLAHIDALEKQWGATPETTLLRADALRMTSQPRAATALYQGLINTAATTPTAAPAWRGLGLIAAAEGDFTQAVSRFTQAQKLAPTDAALLSDLGYALLKARRVAEARVPIMQAAQLQEASPRVQANLALYLLADGQVERAQQVMSQQNVQPALRAAIVREARSIRPDLALQPDGLAEPAAAPAAPADAPLMLKTTSWTVLLDTPR